MKASNRLEWLLSLHPDARILALAKLSSDEKDELRWHWELWARPGQVPPEGDWRTWLVCAGRGFGKTRTGAEWVRQLARSEPDAGILPA
jgi:phage terminase large subunit-like protein